MNFSKFIPKCSLSQFDFSAKTSPNSLPISSSKVYPEADPSVSLVFMFPRIEFNTTSSGRYLSPRNLPRSASWLGSANLSSRDASRVFESVCSLDSSRNRLLPFS